MNQWIGIGHLASDPVAKQTQSGAAMTTFRLGVTTGWGENKQTAWLHIVTFGKRAETCSKYLSKGRKVCVRGSISTGEYTNKDGNKVYTTDIIADEVEFLGGGNGGQTEHDAPAPEMEVPRGFEEVSESDLPF